MRLPSAQPKYNQDIQAKLLQQIETEDAQNHKRGRDVEISPARLIIKSPNGSRWSITVSNAGTLSAVVVV